MSRGLGTTQRAVLDNVAQWNSATSRDYIYAMLAYTFKKPSICRAIKTLAKNGYITESGDGLHATSKGLQYWSDNIADGDI